MQVLNIHTRILDQPLSKVVALMETLSTQNDRIWPREKWPAMRFPEGIKKGATGGHGPIRYTVEAYDPSTAIQFRFFRPEGFKGIHKLEIHRLNDHQTQVKHTIDMTTNFKGTVLWVLGIRWLHDALLEDALDKMENHLTGSNKRTKWSVWVKMLRGLLKG